MTEYFSPRAVLNDGSIVTSKFKWACRLRSPRDEKEHLLFDLEDGHFLIGDADAEELDLRKPECAELRAQINWEASHLLWEMTDYA